MAWAAVASALTTTGKLVAEEASYLWGVEQKVNELQTDLQWMKAFLSSEEVRQAGDGTINLQAANIIELVYDAEDALEAFELKIVSQRKPGFTNRIKRCACILHELWMLRKTRSKIDKITGKKRSLHGRLKTFQPYESRGGGGGSSSLTNTEEQRRPFPHIIDKNTVGLDDDMDKLVTILEDERSEHKVVSICGTGGLGKTTLAKKIYQHEENSGHFQCLAFVYVSQLCEKERVWGDISSKLIPTQERNSEQSVEQLAEQLFKFLDKNKCLVILDDIWDVEAWNTLKPAFSVQRNSKSKILLTTRNTMTVSDADGGGYVYELPRLTNTESWELFQKITSPPTDSPEYEELGMKMVQRCPKLPLAIVALGGILANKNSLIGWRQVSENVEFYLRDDKELKLEKVLALSYDDLPYHLRSCFLYLSHFPEDYTIWTYRLIQLLVAEGIVPPKQEGEIAEDVAEGYLMELAERFMIQPRERDVATLKITSFQIHDEMRRLSLSKAEQENFVFIVDESNACSLSTIQKVRRVSMHKFVGTHYIRCPNLRSLSFFTTHRLVELFQVQTPLACIIGPFSGLSCFWYVLAEYIGFLKSRGFWAHIFINLKLLRVLNYGGLYTYAECKLIGDIGNLIHLRFLSLRNLRFIGSKLPSSLGNLRYLQTLDLRLHHSRDIQVPDVIWRMEQLRHLYLPYRCTNKTKLKLDTLINLLTFVNFNTNNCYVKDLINMKNLRELEIFGAFEIEDFNEELDENPPIFEGKYLHTLSIFSMGKRIDPRHLNHLLSSCASICKLTVTECISKLPELCYLSSNLAYILLRGCNLEEDPMPTLEQLPNLRVLELVSSAYLGKKMLCSAHGFPKLEFLSLKGLNNLERWKVEEGAMPCLQRLEIGLCYRLKRLPDGLRFIKTLQELKIIAMPKAFNNKVVQGGPDLYKVQHVPSVIFQDIEQLHWTYYY